MKLFVTLLIVLPICALAQNKALPYAAFVTACALVPATVLTLI